MRENPGASNYMVQEKKKKLSVPEPVAMVKSKWAGPAQVGGLMTVIEYFISGILCVFQNQMECHSSLPKREIGNVMVFLSHSNHILYGKQDKWNSSFQERGRD
jgi:hypothetical protein